MEVTDIDRAAIRCVISSQLEAFQKDDATGALAFASPEIRAQFGTPEIFMTMVKTSYQAVYRPRSVMFEELTNIQGFPAQQVLLLDENTNLMRAFYLMQKQPDGTWRIAGCYLSKI